MAIPLKDCKQCSHYRGGYCYGFGTAKQVFSTAEALLCGTYTPLGQVQIGPLDSLAGQLTAYQIPDSIISTLKLADLAVTAAKLGISSVSDSKVAAGAGILESKLNLDFSTSDLDADIQTRALLATYLAHNHSIADPTQVDFNNLLNINPLTLDGPIISKTTTTLRRDVKDSFVGIYGGQDSIEGAYLVIYGKDHANSGDIQAILRGTTPEFKIRVYDGASTWTTLFTVDENGDIVTTGDLQIDGDLTVSGGDIKTPSSLAVDALTGVIRLKLAGAEKLYIGPTFAQFYDNLQIAAGKKLGIGKTPSYAVDIQGVNAVDVSLNAERYNDALYGIAWYMKKARGSVATPVIVNNADNLFELLAYGYDGGAFRSAASIAFKVAGVPGASDMPGSITLATTPDGGITPLAALVVNSNQNVGLTQNLTLAAGKTVDGVDVSELAANYDALLMRGVANAAMVPCSVQHIGDSAGVIGKTYGNFPVLENVDTTDFSVWYLCPLPTNKGTQKLYVGDVWLDLWGASAGDYINEIQVVGVIGENDMNTINSDPANKQTAADIVWDFTPEDASPYKYVLIRFIVNVTNPATFKIGTPELQCYYAAT